MPYKSSAMQLVILVIIFSLLIVSPCPVHSAGKPDLVVKEISWSPAAPLTGQEVTFSIALANNGDEASTGVMLSFRTGTQVKNISVPGLVPGARNYVLIQKRRFSVDFNFVIKAEIDSNGQVAESNEANNVLEKTLTVRPSSDFEVSDITWTPASPTTTDRVKLRAVLKNRGPGTSFATYGHFQIANSVKKVPIPALSSGQSHTIVKEYVFSQPFHYVIKFTADPDDEVCEVRENNNVLQKTLAASQAQKPDLTIRNMLLNPASPGLAQPARLTAEVRNLGPGAALPCKLRLRQGGVEKTYTIPPLQANEVFHFNKILVFPKTNTPLVPVELKADSSEKLDEKNENNNVARVIVRVSG